MEAEGELAEQLKSEIRANPVLVYSKSYCPYCANVKQLFASLQVTPKVIEMDRMRALLALVLLCFQNGVARHGPVVCFWRGQCMYPAPASLAMQRLPLCATATFPAQRRTSPHPPVCHSCSVRAANGGKVQSTLQRITGQRTVPQVFVGSEFLGGFSETQHLHVKRGLIPKLDAAGVSHK